MSAKISVIIPSINPGKCLRKCINSVQKQTLRDIEIIIADSSSDEETARILEDALEDNRIQILKINSKSYGALVNAGLEAASAPYVSIIRPGDWAEPDFFKELYAKAAAQSSDILLTDFYMTPAPGESESLYRLPAKFANGKTFDPVRTYDTSLEQSDIFSIDCASGSALISKQILKKYNIWFSENDNSLFHDISFSFKVWACAQKAVLLNTSYLHCGYKGGSVKNGEGTLKQAASALDEYEEIKGFVDEIFREDEKKRSVLLCIMMRLKFDSCLACCDILPSPQYKEFIYDAALEFQKDADEGHVEAKYFPSFDWNYFKTWVYDPEAIIDAQKKSRKPTFVQRLKKAFGK